MSTTSQGYTGFTLAGATHVNRQTTQVRYGFTLAGATHIKRQKIQASLGFTLAEVLVTLGIIGVVAAMTLPAINNKIQDMEFKTAYKAAFSDASQAWSQAISNGEMESVDSEYGSDSILLNNYNAFASHFKKIKTCTTAGTTASCWAINEAGMYTNNCNSTPYHFIDSKGRSWAFMQLNTTSTFDGLCVDTNGLKKPNIFGKDRFFIATTTSKCDPNQVALAPGASYHGHYVPTATCYVGLEDKLLPFGVDFTNSEGGIDGYCPANNCFYKSWLYN